MDNSSENEEDSSECTFHKEPSKLKVQIKNPISNHTVGDIR